MSENLQIYSEKQRKAKIKKEKKRLEEIFSFIETSKSKLVESLINDAAFQRVTLEETREIIQRDGIIEEYQKTPYKTYEDFQTKTVSNLPDKKISMKSKGQYGNYIEKY